MKIHMIRVLVLMLAACLLPAGGFADEAAYELWLGNVQVTEANQGDIFGDGSAVYIGDHVSGTLKLNNASIGTIFTPEEDYSYGICSGIEALTLELSGENTLAAESIPDIGLSALQLTVCGEGMLELRGNLFGLTAAELTMNAGTVAANTVECDGTPCSVGVYADSIYVNGGELSGSAGMLLGDLSYGVYAVENIEISGGTVNGGLDTDTTAVGLIASGKISITGGEINTYGLDDAVNCSEFDLAGGTVRAQGPDVAGDGVCRLVNQLALSGGCFEAQLTGDAASEAPLLYSEQIRFADGFAPSIQAGADAQTAVQIGDPYAYDYQDAYIVIR